MQPPIPRARVVVAPELRPAHIDTCDKCRTNMTDGVAKCL
jgi:hypothetical protein